MATSQTDIRDEVRSITDYDKSIFADDDLDELITIAEDEIKDEVGDYNLDFYNGEETFNQDRALFWLSAMFAKIRSGEIEGVELSAGDLETSSLSAQGSYWFDQYRRRLSQVGSVPGFGSVRVSRSVDRSYEFENR